MSCRALPLDFGIMDGWGISPAANTSRDGCSTFSHLAYFGAFFSGIGFGTGCASGTLVAPGILAVVVTLVVAGTMGQLSSFFGEVHSPKNLFISERQIEFNFPPQFHDAFCQKVLLFPLWWVVLFGKMLQGSGVCNCLLPGNLPDISASIDRHDWRHKPLAVETWWCWGCLERGLLRF